MHYIKLTTLSIVIFLSFYIFNHFIDLPFEANMMWHYLCWGGCTILIFILLVFFNDLRIQFSEKIRLIREREILENIFIFLELFLSSIFVSFFIFVLSAYFTMYFAKTSFTEKVNIIRLKCDEHFKGKYTIFPSFTNVRFEDEITLKHYTLTFRDNICMEKPNIAESLPGKKAMLSGRKSLFGKFYENIELSPHLP